MPIYIRKSVSAGPFRFNFSKGGVGVSVGVKGLRIGTGPRGHYIHAGAGGLYYRATLGNAGRKRSSPELTQSERPPVGAYFDTDVTMVEIESGDVMHMRDESFENLLNEINSKFTQSRMTTTLAWILGGVGFVAGLALGGGTALLFSLLALPGWAIGTWLDSYRRTTVLYYDLEGEAERGYRRLTEGFDALCGCAAKWHIEAGGAVQGLTAWKRNAGASHLVNRKATALLYKLPSIINSNITPPALHVGRQVMYFMPDVVLVQDKNRFGAVQYADLNLRWQPSRFIETERVPSDTTVVGHTWKYPNKNGGPDRRFKDNRQIPICLYESVHFKSNSGINELVEFSKRGLIEQFAEGCSLLAELPRGRKTVAPPVIEDDSSRAIVVEESAIKRNHFRNIAYVLIGLVASFIVLRFFEFGSSQPDANSVSRTTSESSPSLGQDSELNASSPQKVDTAPQPLPSKNTEAVPLNATADVSVKTDANTENASRRYTKTAVNLRKGPGMTFDVLRVIAKDAEVSVLEIKGRWSRVQIDNQNTGWIANSTLLER